MWMMKHCCKTIRAKELPKIYNFLFLCAPFLSSSRLLVSFSVLSFLFVSTVLSCVNILTSVRTASLYHIPSLRCGTPPRNHYSSEPK